jgi:hypothetical protein
MKKSYLLLFILLILTSCSTSFRNPYNGGIESGYRAASEVTYSENNIFFLGEDIYIRVELNDYHCVGCILGFVREGTFVFTFEFLEEQTPPLRVGGKPLPTIQNSDPNKKSYILIEEFKGRRRSESAYVSFHFIATKAGNINYSVILRENNSVAYEGLIFVREV